MGTRVLGKSIVKIQIYIVEETATQRISQKNILNLPHSAVSLSRFNRAENISLESYFIFNYYKTTVFKTGMFKCVTCQMTLE